MQLWRHLFLNLSMIACPVCSLRDAMLLCSISGMPAVGCSFADSRAAALAADRGDLEPVSCRGCGHVFNRAFDSGRAVYAYRRWHRVRGIDPRRAGRFIPGSAQPIVTPDFLREYRPDAVIVMNGEYLPEMRAALSAMNLDSSVMVATTALS